MKSGARTIKVTFEGSVIQQIVDAYKEASDGKLPSDRWISNFLREYASTAFDEMDDDELVGLISDVFTD